MTRDWSNDDFVGGCLSLDFANTVHDRVDTSKDQDLLGTYADLVSWARAAGTLTSSQASRLTRLMNKDPKQAASAFRRAIRLREAIYRAFAAVADEQPPNDKDIESICSAFAEAGRRLSVVPGDDGIEMRWRLAAEDASGLLAPIAFSASELLLCDDLKRLKQCRSCGWLFLDKSKGGRRRWCDMKTCGNRAKVTRFRQKRL
jgi:predicted RNA-binding Zn ribbon-like protein